MDNNIEISVVIPFYNASKTIERALNSVLKQSFQSYEIIIVDDGSEESHFSKLQDIVSCLNDSKIKLIRLDKNSGAATARNVGWNNSLGKYIAFLDSDDSWISYKLELQYNFMKDNTNVSLSSHSIEIISEADQINSNIEDINPRKISKKEILLKNPLPTPTVMIKKDIPYRFEYGRRYVDDHLLWMEIILDDNEAVKLENKLAYVYKPMYGASGLSSHILRMEKAELQAYKKVYKSKKINIMTFLFVIVWSLAKFFRRLLILLIRKVIKK